MKSSFQRKLGLGAVTASILFWSAVASAQEQPMRNNECMDCHSDKTLNTTNSAGRVISLYVDLSRLAATPHKTNTCASCHSDLTRKHPDDNILAKPVNCAKCHQQQSGTYRASVHGVANRRGELASATCSDCHDGHSILPPTDAASPLHYSHLAQTCGACHAQEAKDVAQSVHGKALAAGRREAPTCTDCHSEHKIETLRASSPLKSADVCSKCHASERLNTKYNLPQDRVKTFFDSYHGLAAQYGSTLAANCSSCHGVHKILPSIDAESTIHPNHLVETCGKCHPGATANFALSKVHVDSAAAASPAQSDVGGLVNWWVRRLYLILIATVIGGMLLHNGLIMLRKIAASRRSSERPLLRMSLGQRWQHAVLGLSFVVLAVSGFALKFPDSWIAVLLGSSEPLRRDVHRIAGLVLIGVGVYHLAYILFTRDGRKLVRDFYPRLKDLKDVFGNLLYHTGLSKNRPAIARFGYAEKMEYWAVIWGIIIMGATGFMVWFKLDVTRFLPRWAVDVALTIHYYEAILACLAIVVWHFYHVIFDPEVYPLNWAALDGRVSQHWHDEEHPLETPVPANTIIARPSAAPARPATPAEEAKPSAYSI